MTSSLANIIVLIRCALTLVNGIVKKTARVIKPPPHGTSRSLHTSLSALHHPRQGARWTDNDDMKMSAAGSAS